LAKAYLEKNFFNPPAKAGGNTKAGGNHFNCHSDQREESENNNSQIFNFESFRNKLSNFQILKLSNFQTLKLFLISL